MKFQSTLTNAAAHFQKKANPIAKQSLWLFTLLLLLTFGCEVQVAFGQCSGEVLNISNPNPTRTVSGTTWIVPSGGPYKVRITAKGSRGGVAGNYGEVPGGSGATMIGEFILGSGQTLRAVAGAPGSNTGGGGGSGVEIQGPCTLHGPWCMYGSPTGS